MNIEIHPFHSILFLLNQTTHPFRKYPTTHNKLRLTQINHGAPLINPATYLRRFHSSNKFFHTFYFPRTQLSRPQSGRDKKDEMRLSPRPGHPVRLLVVEKCCDNVPSLVLSIRPSQWAKPSLSGLGQGPQRTKPHIFFRVRGCVRGV